ncbi:UDP-N-acetylmuramate dehydrogenase [Sinobacterium caligoides]|uniref:UDP-N-acetylenolpyruvoylglucosamine reductase n=1 Tax=Sinobacterium caligoides TaxID=933926 RepID=A0A3N2DKF5_9GAMM|nr:UDP-N-acetylmuramate dehydrogenase [Sinobacterium caligoides]ROS00280.1 UDP-N-acetylmuramate dehydrogenase [Sinobacterium caligoides]
MTAPISLDVKSDYDISALNTLSLPCVARYFVELESAAQLPEVVDFARRKGVPLQVIGGGSNLVVPDYLDALVVLNGIRGRVVEIESPQHAVLHVGAGENWHDLVAFSLDNHLYGIENLALIPGCAGAAPVQNIGAYGREVSDVLVAVDTYNPETGESQRLSAKQCRLAYRDSVFKHESSGLIITAISIRLSTVDQPYYRYQALQQYLEAEYPERYKAGEIGAQEVFAAVIAVRRSKLPDPAVLPNAGSFFKNPVVTKQDYEQLKATYPGLVGYLLPTGDYKLAAGWLIDNAGWRGRALGAVAMHEKQALVLVNLGGANRADVEALRRQVCVDCLKRYGVTLEAEPRWL